MDGSRAEHPRDSGGLMWLGVGATGWRVIELPDFRVPLHGGCGATSQIGTGAPEFDQFPSGA